MNDEQRKAIIPELDDCTARANALKEELNALVERYELWKEKNAEIVAVTNQAYKLVSALEQANDTLKRARAPWVQECITSWYRDLHFDMHPLVEIAEEDLPDPVYECITYKGKDEWEIIMQTATHGRERIVIHACNGVDWPGVYSADPA